MEFIPELTQEKKRGCGYRHGGDRGFGLYLMGDMESMAPCCRLPIPVTACEHCGQSPYPNFGKPIRGLVRVNARWFNNAAKPPAIDDVFNESCALCIANNVTEDIGLMWVGAEHYPTPADFLREAQAQGISKRVSQVPEWAEPDRTVIGLVHPNVKFEAKVEGFANPYEFTVPAVFMVFRLRAIHVTVDSPDPVTEEDPAGKELIRLREKFGEHTVQLIYPRPE